MTTQEELLAKAAKPSREALRLHRFYRGKVQVLRKCRRRTPPRGGGSPGGTPAPRSKRFSGRA